MSTLIQPPKPQVTESRTAIPPRFQSAAEWLHSLGDVSLERIVFDPWPGTATEQDMIRMVERDKRFVELLDGTLVEKPMGNYESMIAALISHAILSFVLPRKLGAVAGEQSMVRMSFGRVRMPDVTYTSFARCPDGKVPRDAILGIAPDLAVQVLSESSTRLEIQQKLTELFASGTRLAWIVDPEAEAVEIYIQPHEPLRVLRGAESLDGGDVLPGFALSLPEIFHTYD
jgi:Uma2 family endonuclease